MRPLIENIEALVLGDDAGALVSFTGRVRNHRHRVTHLDYEAYGPTATKTLLAIKMMKDSFPGVRIALQHRLGRLEIGEVASSCCGIGPPCSCFLHVRHYRPFESRCAHLQRSRGDGSVWVRLGR